MKNSDTTTVPNNGTHRHRLAVTGNAEGTAVYPRIFVSYSRNDEFEVIAITDSLRSQGHSLWIDREGIPSSAIWRDEIAFAIEQCEVLVFFVSEHSVKSEEARKELDYAVTKGKRIVPVMLCPMCLSGGFALQINRIQRFERWKEDGQIDISALDVELRRVLTHRVPLTDEKNKAANLVSNSGQHTQRLVSASVILRISIAAVFVCIVVALGILVARPTSSVENSVPEPTSSRSAPDNAQTQSQYPHAGESPHATGDVLDRPGKLSPDP